MTFKQVVEHVRETALLESVESLLGWDERTLMPKAAGQYRADQITYLSGLIHQRHTDPRLGQWLAELHEDDFDDVPAGDHTTTIRQLKRDYEKRCKLPQRLVEELSRAAVLGQQTWSQARKDNDFSSFQPHLETIIRLKREQAEAVGYDDHVYDALLDDFEPDEKTADVTAVLAQLRDQLVPLVSAIVDRGKASNRQLWQRCYPIQQQREFAQQVVASLGFSFDRGRLDETDHPFCSSMGPHDCRITTRFDEHYFPAAFFGMLHEAGHGMYDQGLRADQYGLPPGTYLSLGIHESQSRLWENAVGRSRAFWNHFYAQAQRTFAEALGTVDLDTFYLAINDVRPSLIRVEADEATYDLHIIVRFELEQALLSGDLKVADLPQAWNQRYQTYLGIVPESDGDGVLQDIHWSAALIGYFPTYSLGNLYAAQFFEQANRDLGGIDELVQRGEFAELLQWLRERIHKRGQCLSARALVEEVTGRPLEHGPLVDRLTAKLKPLYDLA